MADKAMDVYLNDHLAGAKFGSDLADQLRAQNQGNTLGAAMQSLAPLIEQDRQTLIGVLEKMGTSENPVKQATTWIAEKAIRLKFAGDRSGGKDLGTFMAVETLTLGVEGKRSLWITLKAVADRYPQLASVDLDGLIERAQSQHDQLERERVAAAERALQGEITSG